MPALPAPVGEPELSFKKDIPLDVAEEIAIDFLTKTKDLYRKCLLAGSIRRREPVVHDVDFAVIPKDRSFGRWKDNVTERLAEIGGTVATFGEVISSFRYRGIQVNLFLCLNEDAWGVTQMWATGPKGHTIGMTIKARDRGLIINAKGLWTREEPPRLIRTRTEVEVGRILGWKFRAPEARGKGSKRAPSFE
jgi:DNA polymerase/3'-5' exonuclease PolX